jgi:hypothetical protein
MRKNRLKRRCKNFATGDPTVEQLVQHPKHAEECYFLRLGESTKLRIA